LIAEKVYDQLIGAGMTIPVLPLENVALVSAFRTRTRRIKKQALLEFCIGGDRFESVFLISPQLINPAILGASFARDYGIVIDFGSKCFYYERWNEEETFVSSEFRVLGCQKGRARVEGRPFP
jgi:hypothetical protein